MSPTTLRFSGSRSMSIKIAENMEKSNRAEPSNLKRLLQTALVWISGKLPSAHPQFQIVYSESASSGEED
jgi:hypothetical protein